MSILKLANLLNPDIHFHQLLFDKVGGVRGGGGGWGVVIVIAELEVMLLKAADGQKTEQKWDFKNTSGF